MGDLQWKNRIWKTEMQVNKTLKMELEEQIALGMLKAS